MSKREPIIEGDWPWHYYLIGALFIGAAIAIIVRLHG
jgi:hypothetical protein